MGDILQPPPVVLALNYTMVNMSKLKEKIHNYNILLAQSHIHVDVHAFTVPTLKTKSVNAL